MFVRDYFTVESSGRNGSKRVRRQHDARTPVQTLVALRQALPYCSRGRPPTIALLIRRFLSRDHVLHERKEKEKKRGGGGRTRYQTTATSPAHLWPLSNFRSPLPLQSRRLFLPSFVHHRRQMTRPPPPSTRRDRSRRDSPTKDPTRQTPETGSPASEQEEEEK